jgi:WhiB family redox-sensing transcriptional regulator
LVRARAVCADCGVRKECLEFALTTNQDCGVWGGTSEEERRDIRRRNAAARRASLA